MPKINLTKSGLQREKQQLQLYVKLLPSLELKRTQLLTEYTRAKMEMTDFKKASEQIISEIAHNIPMLANQEVQISGLLKIGSIVLAEQNVVGVKLPLLQDVQFDVSGYSFMATPHWVDAVMRFLKEGVESKIHLNVMEMRIKKLGVAVRRMTQRVNLFEKILIPSCKKNIQKIQIALNDAERSAVIRSKLAKALHIKQSGRQGGNR